IEMPSPLPVRAKSFDLNYNQLASPTGGGGFIQTIDRGPTLWLATYESAPLTGERLQKFQAFLDELEGSLGTFLAFDPNHVRPYAYRKVGGKPWVQTGQADSRVIGSNMTNSTLSLDRVQPGTVFTPHDYISFKQGNAWYLYRVDRKSVV